MTLKSIIRKIGWLHYILLYVSFTPGIVFATFLFGSPPASSGNLLCSTVFFHSSLQSRYLEFANIVAGENPISPEQIRIIADHFPVAEQEDLAEMFALVGEIVRFGHTSRRLAVLSDTALKLTRFHSPEQETLYKVVGHLQQVATKSLLLQNIDWTGPLAHELEIPTLVNTPRNPIHPGPDTQKR